MLAFDRHYVTYPCWPVEWIASFGNGRLYGSSFWHVSETDLGVPDRMLCRGSRKSRIRAAKWVATIEATYPVPKDSPTGDTVVIRGR